MTIVDYLKALAARFAGRLDTFFPPSEDPSLGVREPRRRGPGGRSSAAAVAEPEEPTVVGAYGAGNIKR
jgi:hypothetical protein